MSEIRDSLNVLGPSIVRNMTIDGERFIIPRLTTDQRNTIATPEVGLVIFNTTTTSLEAYTGSVWFQYAYNGSNNAVPVGFCGFILSNTIPAGYLELNGQTFNQAIYPELFVQNLNSNVLPNFKGLFPRGAGTGDAFTDTSISINGVRTTTYTPTGPTLRAKQGDAIRNIKGTMRFHWNATNGFWGLNTTGAFRKSVNQAARLQGTDQTFAPTPSLDFDASYNVPTAADNHPMNIGVVFIIKATV